MLLLLLVCLAQMLVFLVEFALHCLLLRHQFGSHDGILRGILHPHHRTAIDGRNLQGDMQFTGRGTTNHNRYLQTSLLQFLGHVDHFLETRRNQTAQPDHIHVLLLSLADNLLGRPPH